jgi:hypothetical protein
MRLLPVFCAVLLVAGTPALAGSKNVKTVKSSPRPWREGREGVRGEGL